MEEDDIILSQALEKIEEAYPAEFFNLASEEDILLTQACQELEEFQNEQKKVCADLSLPVEDLEECLESAVDCRSMAGVGGSDVVSSWKYPKKTG